jgi:hypothetical protein
MNITSMGAIIPMLARTHRVYALEFHGHGRTTARHPTSRKGGPTHRGFRRV